MRDDRYRLGVVMKYAAIAMAVLYIFLGFFILSYGRRSFSIPPGFVAPFGIMLIAYGLFRGQRTYLKYFKARHYENDDASE
jgi:hypothetical protein